MARLPNLVKGIGYARVGGVAPIEDPNEVLERSIRAEKAIREATRQGIANARGGLTKALSPAFASQFGLFLQQNPMGYGLQSFASELSQQLSDLLGKNISLTSPLASGIVPFDLVAPSRLIFPVYSPIRNKLPRVPGQGTSRRAKVMTAISGSQTGGAAGNPVRIGIAEFPGGGSFANWPMQLPPSGQQAMVDLNVPYKFFGLSEALSWLAQFAGQGFEDISALANLILLSEFMLAEEYLLLAGTGANLAAPPAPTLSARAAATGETPLSGVSTNLYVRVTATTFYGETPAGAVAQVAPTSGQVVDVTITPVRGALQYNIYVATGTSDPGATASRLMVQGVGATRVTLQGALPTGGATPPTADTGTGNPNDFEGLVSILSGHAATDAGVYPAGFAGGYVNQSVNDVLSVRVLNTAFQQLWDGPGAFRADPAEIICEGSDAVQLANSILSNAGAGAAYRLLIDQGDVGGIRAGAAVSEVQNPITRSVVRLLVHPYLPQGTAMLMSYTLPQSWSNVANVFEMTLVQDYLSIAWPVIDASFRYSIFMYGALVAYAPQYCGLVQGLQRSAAPPYS